MSKELIDAVKEGNTKELVRLLSEKGANSDLRDSDDTPLIVLAAKSKNLDIVKIIIRADANIDSQDATGNTALHYAALADDGELTQYLLDQSANSDKKNDKRQTPTDVAKIFDNIAALNALSPGDNPDNLPLIQAVQAKNLDTVRELIAHADLLKDSDQLNKAFLKAALLQANEIVELLLKSGADANSLFSDANPDNALLPAIIAGNTELVNILLNYGIDAHYQDNKGISALMCAASHGKIEIIKLLLTNGVKINQKDIKGNTALHYADSQNYYDIIKLLLQNGAEIEGLSKSSPIFETALRDKDIDLIKVLIKAKRIPSENDHIQSALALALSAKDKEVLSLLFSQKYQFDLKNSRMYEAYETAIKDGDLEQVKYILSHSNFSFDKKSRTLKMAKADDGLYAAIQNGRAEIIEFLLKEGLKLKESYYYEALEKAITYKHPEVLSLLIENGIEITRQVNTSHGHCPPLIHAILSSSHEIVQLLLDNEVKVDSLVLETACENNKIDIIAVLAEKAKTQINVLTRGKTLLMKAAEKSSRDSKQLAVVEQLLKSGADPRIKNADGNNLLVDAIAKKNHALLQTILLSTTGEVLNALFAEQKNGLTPLMLTVTEGDLEALEMLLNAGAEVDACNAEERTALALAVLHKQSPEVIKLLLAAGADIETKDQGGSTPLLLAAGTGQQEIFQFLLTQGASSTAKNLAGKGAFSIARDNGHEQLCRYILDPDESIKIPSTGSKATPGSSSSQHSYMSTGFRSAHHSAAKPTSPLNPSA